MGAGLTQAYVRRLSSRDASGKWRIDDMYFSIHKQALWGMVVGAIAISGASGCSRSDRAGTGRDTTQSGAVTSTPTDTGTTASTQPAGDTALPSTRDTTTTAVAPSEAPKRSEASKNDTTTSQEPVSGYREMDRDTSVGSNATDSSGTSGDSAVSSATADTASAEMAGAANASDSAGAAGEQAVTADTTAVDTTTTGYSEMARDTSSTAAPGDTSRVAISDSAAPAESDSGTVQVQMDTSTAQASADTAAVSADTVTVAAADSADTTAAQSEQVAVQDENADTLQDNAGRIRPPEDSTEVLGNVTTDSATVATREAADQSQAEPIRPPEDSTEIAGNVTRDENGADVSSREVPTEASGAAAMGHPVTGIDAVAVMSRGGVRCVVKDDATEVWWDMGDSPSALNPCGTGTMTLSLVKSGEK
jgi:hypothetical protein